MSSRRADLVSLLEAAYDVEQDEEAWLRGVVQAALPLFPGTLGTMAFACDRSMEHAILRPTVAVSDGLPPELVAHLRSCNRQLPQEFAEAFWALPVSTTLRLVGSLEVLRATPYAREFHQMTGAVDGHGIVGRNPIDRSVALSTFMTSRIRLTDGFIQRWSRVAAHLAAGIRLQQRIAGAPPASLDEADAILHPDGRVAHARGVARPRATRAKLTEAATLIDRARSTLRRDPDEALAGWRALVEGRWSLVDHFDHDGRRYLVARPNQPGTRRSAALDERERAVVAYAALGHANKLIAYELGLPQSTVSIAIRAAAKKLGARSRLDLIRMLAPRRGSRPEDGGGELEP